jgi:hypothetical protein
MGTSRGLALLVTVGGIGGGASRGESRNTTLLPSTEWSLNRTGGRTTGASLS